MKVEFWGVRGSFPVPGPDTVQFGGNTSCVELRGSEGQVMIVDAGTGIRLLGNKLMEENFGRGRGKANIFLSHTHWDHIQGLPFFRPIYVRGNDFNIFARKTDEQNLKTILYAQTEDPYFPVPFQNLQADVDFKELSEGADFDLEGVRVRAERLNHPWIALGYRFDDDKGSVAYISDTAPFRDVLLEKKYYESVESGSCDKRSGKFLSSLAQRVEDMVRGVDVLIYDSQFSTEEYNKVPHWGHSTPEEGIDLALKAGARMLVLFHHAPERSDASLREAREYYSNACKGTGLCLEVAREGLEIDCETLKVNFRAAAC